MPCLNIGLVFYHISYWFNTAWNNWCCPSSAWWGAVKVGIYFPINLLQTSKPNCGHLTTKITKLRQFLSFSGKATCLSASTYALEGRKGISAKSHQGKNNKFRKHEQQYPKISFDRVMLDTKYFSFSFLLISNLS